MKRPELRFDTVMSDAQIIDIPTEFRQQSERNHSALVLSIQNFASLFQENAQLAVANVLVSYFSSIDSCESKSDFMKAQQLFNNALDFLHCEKIKPGVNKQQKAAIFRGITELHKEWCFFIKANRDEISHSKREEFLTSISHVSSLSNRRIKPIEPAS